MVKKRNFNRRKKTRTKFTKVDDKRLTMLWKSIERKNSDVPLSAVPIPQAGLLFLLNGLIRGNDSDNRVGRKCTWLSIQINQSIRTALPPVVTISTNFRYIFLVDTQANGQIAPLIADILQTPDPWAHVNYDNRKRFRFIFDKFFVMVPGAFTSSKVFDFTLKIPKRYQVTTYDLDSTGSATDIRKNAYYLLMITNEGTDLPVTTADLRLTYLDN